MARTPTQFIHDLKVQIGHDGHIAARLVSYRKGLSLAEAERLIASKHNPLVEDFARQFGGGDKMSIRNPKVKLYKDIKKDVRKLLTRFLEEYGAERVGYKAGRF